MSAPPEDPRGLALDVEVRRGEAVVRAGFGVGASETVALVGPNGAGKSTILGAACGLLRVDRGRVALRGDVLDGGPDGPFVPPEARRVGVVLQDLALFPHMTALDNVAFGPRSRGASRADARARARIELEAVGLQGTALARRPAALSGGEAQRVALARALAADPRALLLDEPLSAVDAGARGGLLRGLRARLGAFDGPRLIVVHDVRDALALADRVVVLEGGRVVQSGRAADLARAPRTAYVADLVGINGYAGRASAGVVRVGEAALQAASTLEGDVIVTIHPRAVSLFPERPEGSPRNAWPMVVVSVEPGLDRVRVELDGALRIVAEVTPSASAELGVEPGQRLWGAVKATEIGVAPA